MSRLVRFPEAQAAFLAAHPMACQRGHVSPDDSSFDAEYFEDCRRLLEAVFLVALYRPEAYEGEAEIVDLLRGCKGGFGCWLTWFEDTLLEMDFHAAHDDLGDCHPARIHAAFQMAKVLLWSLHNPKGDRQ